MAKALKVDSEGNIRLAQLLSYTKHYYIGSERVSAKTGTMDKLGYYPLNWLTNEMSSLNIAVQDNSASRFVKAADVVASIHQLFGSSLSALNTTDNYIDLYDDTHDPKKMDIFYFHPDHLGSSSYITNMAGMVSQHMEYLPFGELLVDEHKNSYNSPFKYNGKEFDEETGNYFYGARYYDPKWSIFISVDPLAEDAPDWTPYRYGFNNPIRYTDPTGMYEYDFDDHWEIQNGKAVLIDTEGDDIFVRNAGDGEYAKLSDTDFTNNINAAQDIIDYYSKENSLFSKEPSTDFQPFRLMVKYFSNKEDVIKQGYRSDAMMAMRLEIGKKIDISGYASLFKGKFNQVLNNKHNMTNTIEHEYKHYLDYVGLNAKMNYGFKVDADQIKRSQPQLELRAIDYQRSRPSWNNTTKEFKAYIKNYEDLFKSGF